MTSDIKEKIKMSKIEQLIGEIEEFIDGCKLQPFSSTKIVVDKAQLEDLLVELRHRTPDDGYTKDRQIEEKHGGSVL